MSYGWTVRYRGNHQPRRKKNHKIDDFSGFMCLTDVILTLKATKLKDKAYKTVLEYQ